MEQVGLYRWTDKYTAPDSTSVERKGPKVRRGQIVELTHLSVVDYTTADKTLLIGYEDAGGDNHYLNKEDSSSKFQAHLNGRIMLLPDESPLGVVETPTSSDVLYFSAFGIIYEYPPEGV